MWLPLLVLLMSPVAQGAPQAEFLIQPTRVTVKEGQPAVFVCSVKAGSPFESASVTWSDNYKTYQDSDASISINEELNSTVVTSHLQLLDTNRHSRKYFKCAVSISFRSGVNVNLASSLVGVDVQYFLKGTDLECRRLPVEKFYREHEGIDIECEAPNTNPPVALKWVVCSHHHSSLFSLPEKQISTRLGDRTLLRIPLITDRHLHNKELCCVSTSSAFEGERLNCSLAPFKIAHAPQVEVVPDRNYLMPPIVLETRVRCNVLSFPNVSELSWSCDPPYPFTSCKSSGPYLNVSLARPFSEATGENVTVTCSGGNMLGRGEGMVTIGLSYIDVASLKDCPGKTQNVNVTLIKGDLMGNDTTTNNPLVVRREMQSLGDVFYCSFKNNNVNTMSSGFQMMWYVNGYIVRRHTPNSSHPINEDWRFVLPHRSNENAERVIVACEVGGLERNYVAACIFDYWVNPEPSTTTQSTLQKSTLIDVTTTLETKTTTRIFILPDTSSAGGHEEKGTSTVSSKTQTVHMMNGSGRASSSQRSSLPIAWMLVVAVIVGFVLLACVVGVVKVVQKVWSRSRNTLNMLDGVYQTTVVKSLTSPGQSFPTQEPSTNGQAEQEPLYAIPDDDTMTTAEKASRNYLWRPHLSTYDFDETLIKCIPPKEFRNSCYSSPGSLDSSTAESEELYIRSSFEGDYSDISSSSGSHVYENKNVVHFGASDKHSAYYKAKRLHLPGLQSEVEKE